jgi:hypothetical protein
VDARVVWSAVAVVHGDLDTARGLVRDAEEEAYVDDAVQAPGLRMAQARIAAAEGDREAGVSILRSLLASESGSAVYWPRLLDQMRLYAGLAVAVGDDGLAAEAVQLAVRGADRNPGVDSFRGVALQVSGFVSGDPATLGLAVEMLRRSPRPFMLASALTDSGSALLRVGARTRAIAQLDEALAIFEALDAKSALAEVHAVLRRAGVRPRHHARAKAATDVRLGLAHGQRAEGRSAGGRGPHEPLRRIPARSVHQHGGHPPPIRLRQAGRAVAGPARQRPERPAPSLEEGRNARRCERAHSGQPTALRMKAAVSTGRLTKARWDASMVCVVAPILEAMNCSVSGLMVLS